MTCMIRIALTLSIPCVALACESDPGDVGSGTEESDSNGGTDSSGGGDSQSATTANDDDDDSVSTTDPSGTTEGGGTTAVTTSDDGPGTEGTTANDEAASTEDAGTETGTMVESCADCGPNEGCVAEVAFAIEYFCVPWPETCEHEFDCACASQFCTDPFTICTDFPDPPQTAIACECPTC
jgi:hypothetical protein